MSVTINEHLIVCELSKFRQSIMKNSRDSEKVVKSLEEAEAYLEKVIEENDNVEFNDMLTKQLDSLDRLMEMVDAGNTHQLMTNLPKALATSINYINTKGTAMERVVMMQTIINSFVDVFQRVRSEHVKGQYAININSVKSDIDNVIKETFTDEMKELLTMTKYYGALDVMGIDVN